MDIIKLTDEEVTNLTTLRKSEIEFIEQLGQIEYQIQSLELKKDEIKTQLSKFFIKRNVLATELQTKYGQGSINIDSGEFIKDN